MKFAVMALSLVALTVSAQAQERRITLGPGNTPPGLFKPKPNPPPAEFKGKCTVLPCGVKPVQFVPGKPVHHKPVIHHRPVIHRPVRPRPS